MSGIKKNHFFFGYCGNKRQEVDHIYNALQPCLNSIDTIVEPYCGTSAVSFYIALKHPKKFTYILNDNNVMLIKLYEVAKDEQKFNDLILSLNETMIGIDKAKYKSLDNNSLEGFIIHNKIFNIQPGLFPLNYIHKPEPFNFLRDVPIVQFLRNENVILQCGDALTLFSRYKNETNVLQFVDPPYVSADNSTYKSPDTNIYEALFHQNIDSMDSKICLCLANNWIIKLLFQHNHQNEEYDKQYQNSTKRKTKHIVVYNDKLLNCV
jgi:site-specific DNA-adenine methylase